MEPDARAQVNGRRIHCFAELDLEIGLHLPGRPVALTVSRNGARKQILVPPDVLTMADVNLDVSN